VALSWLATSATPQLVLSSALIMAVAETLRQYLAYSFVNEVRTPRQLFFFGAIYQDAPAMFFNRDSKPPLLFSRGRKFLALAGVFFLSLLVRASPPFASADFLQVALFCLVLTIWINCATFKSLSRLLLLQLLITAALFLAAPDASIAGFLFWLFCSLWIQKQLHGWHLAEATAASPHDFTLNFSISDFTQTVMLMLLLFVVFRTADFFVPAPDQPQITFQAGSKTMAVKGRPTVPKKLLNRMAKVKLQAGAVNLKALAFNGTEKELNLPGGVGKGLPDVSKTQFSSPFAFGENQRELEELKSALASGKSLTDADLNRFSALSKKIHTDAEVSANTATSETEIDERIEKLKSLQHDEPKTDLSASEKKSIVTEDDAAEYVRMRNELAKDVDSLIVQDQKSTVAKEEENLQKHFEKIAAGLKKFAVLLALTALLAYWLSRKPAAPASEDEPKKDFALPKEVRMRLKTLYQILLSGNFSARDEVLKSFYIVELAFKEIEFAREDDLPPLNFLEKISRELPFVFNSAKTPIDLFSRVFYGDKNPDDMQIKELRSSMHDLMKKLRVI
jgi:hypothetical protein